MMLRIFSGLFTTVIYRLLDHYFQDVFESYLSSCCTLLVELCLVFGLVCRHPELDVIKHLG